MGQWDEWKPNKSEEEKEKNSQVIRIVCEKE